MVSVLLLPWWFRHNRIASRVAGTEKTKEGKVADACSRAQMKQPEGLRKGTKIAHTSSSELAHQFEGFNTPLSHVGSHLFAIELGPSLTTICKCRQRSPI